MSDKALPLLALTLAELRIYFYSWRRCVAGIGPGLELLELRLLLSGGLGQRYKP